MSKVATITKEEVAELFSRSSYVAGIDPDRIRIRDIMVLPATEDDEERTDFQATVAGYTDWYSLEFGADGLPDPAKIIRQPF